MPAQLNLKTNGKTLWPGRRPEYGNDRSRRGNAGPWKAWENDEAAFPPFPQTLEIDDADFHIPTPRLLRG
jgi:hypothetical protein